MYAEFLNHPPGVCPIVDPAADGCSRCRRKSGLGDTVDNYRETIQSEKGHCFHSGGSQGGRMEGDGDEVGAAAAAAAASRDVRHLICLVSHDSEAATSVESTPFVSPSSLSRTT